MGKLTGVKDPKLSVETKRIHVHNTQLQLNYRKGSLTFSWNKFSGGCTTKTKTFVLVLFSLTQSFDQRHFLMLENAKKTLLLPSLSQIKFTCGKQNSWGMSTNKENFVKQS